MKDPAAVNKTEPGIIGGPLRIHQKIFVPNAVNKTKPGNFVPTRPTAGKNSGQERGKL